MRNETLTLERLERPGPRVLSWPHRVILAEGWARRGLAFLAGACGALALEPVDFLPAMAASLILAVWLLDGCADNRAGRGFAAKTASLRMAAGVGWWWGFGYFLAGLWWLGTAMLVEPDQFAWALPLATLGMPAALALFPALGFALARLLWSSGALRVLALAVGIGGAEWLRGHVLTGFPWNDVGMALATAPALAQSASLIGLHGLDLAAIVILAAPATLIDEPDRGGDARSRRRGRAARADDARRRPAPVDARDELRSRNGPASDAAQSAAGRQIPPRERRRHSRPLSTALGSRDGAGAHSGVADATHIIWPESAFPFRRDAQAQGAGRKSRASLQGKILITGAARAEEGTGARSFSTRSTCSRAVASSPPMTRSTSFPSANICRSTGCCGRSAFIISCRGSGTSERDRDGFPFRACRRPRRWSATRRSSPARPSTGARRGREWMLNVTNDGWFGRTSGPYQHFAQARLRAIEEGLPLVRVANTGVSAIVDPYGRVLQSLPLGVEGVIDGALPKAAPPTFFARHGAFVFPALWAALLCGALYGRLRR